LSTNSVNVPKKGRPRNNTSEAMNTETQTKGLNKRLYSIKEASTYLGRSIWAVREMLWAGKLPYVRDGKRILLDIRDMETWIDKNKTQFTF